MDDVQTARVQTELDASAGHVWALVGDFSVISAWAPGANLISTEGAGVGALRTIRTVLGDFVERCDEVDATLYRLRYSIVESPWPVRDYAAQVQLVALDRGRSFIEWSGSFSPTGDAGAAFRAQIQRMYLSFVREVQRSLLR